MSQMEKSKQAAPGNNSSPAPGFSISRARNILATEGIKAFTVRSWRYLVSSVLGLEFKRFNLIEHCLIERPEDLYRPKFENLTTKVITTNAQADEAAGEGFEDFRKFDLGVDPRKCFDAGAVAFCFYAGRELAHIGWVALTREAQDTFDNLPYRVDFAHGQACTGGTVTISKFRGRGLMTYGYFKRLEYLRERGYKTSRNVVEVHNKASLNVHAKFESRICARAYYLKVGRRIFWKETPIRASQG